MIPWAELWEAEPGLRPEGVTRDRDGYYLNNYGPLGVDAIPDSAGDELCFARAAKWLTEKHYIHIERRYEGQGGPGDWAPRSHASPLGGWPKIWDSIKTVPMSATMEEAAFLTCKALIGAKTAAPG